MPEPVVEAILALKKRHPSWGGKKIHVSLWPQDPPVCVRTVDRVLKRAGLVQERGTPAPYDQVVEELLPVDHPRLPVTKLGVCGLWGNAREMVLGSPLASKRPYWKDHLVAVSKPLGAREKFWHPGLRIELYPYYHAHNPRLFNIEPPTFRVAHWPFSQEV